MDLTGFDLSRLAAAIHAVLATPVGPIAHVGTLALLPVLAMAYLALVSRFALRRFRFARVLAVHFRLRFLKHRSHGLDVLLTIANIYVFTVLLGWAIISALSIGGAISAMLVGVFGSAAPSTLSATTIAVIWVVALVLAYEFGYWLDHYLAHTVPILWEFHKVHHSAEALTPLTVYRVHPVDTLVFYNILAVVNGVVIGLLTYTLGDLDAGKSAFQHRATYLLIAMHAVGYFQHSQFWIPFTGWLGRLILSPAHHQIHHSVAKEHHDRNFGSFLAIFDWLFGTLHVPTKKREKLKFGVEGIHAHTLTESLVQPFADAAHHLPDARRRERAPG
jgi:sterol desaturase/sphingolipid hydroxylase (fatty acid hydroxylase superfamily)